MKTERRGDSYHFDTADNGQRRRITDNYDPSKFESQTKDLEARLESVLKGKPITVRGPLLEVKGFIGDVVEVQCTNCGEVRDVAIVRDQFGFYLSLIHQCSKRP